MTRQLKSISIRNFRSIRGEINIPLDAPVVLIHGQNGAGKTSILSALELGLTGHIQSLRSLDTDYTHHLVHKEAAEGHIVVSATGISDGADSAEISVQSNGVTGSGLLVPEMSRFYSERCYLSQATLGRLLELYQVKDTRKSDSPLTKFVKDLLGLDRLDALIDGLYDSGNVRRFRTTVPAFWDVRESIPELEKKVRQKREERTKLEATRNMAYDLLQSKLAEVGIGSETELTITELQLQLADNREEAELLRLATLRREVAAVRQQWHSVDTKISPTEHAQAELAVESSTEEFRNWQATEGHHLEGALSSVAELLPETASLSSAGMEQALAAAVEAVASDLKRCADQLTSDVEDTSLLEALDQDLSRARTRLGVLEEQIEAQAVTSGSLAQALSDVLSHIHTEDCPVCGRDFKEISDRPLQAHVSDQVAALTESAGRLQALSRERAEAVRMIALVERDRGSIAGRLLAPAARDQFKIRRARLKELERSLNALTQVAARGGRLSTQAAEAARILESLRARDQQVVSIRTASERLAQQLRVEPIGLAESLETALDRFNSEISLAEARLLNLQSIRLSAQSELKQYVNLGDELQVLTTETADQERRLEQLRNAMAVAEDRIIQSRELMRRAREARTNVVRRVFNDSLNAIWRDLFVRLAPEEPFVPAFALPENQDGPVEAVLETLYRSGGKGGDPRAMLSAGNLNTAALTLFLALHLSVEPTLPWLIIDDPVQSMDEVHIAQFAALLRTLSKQHGRQVVIAVHERPLFEYLALELSPAFPTDRLITVELGRSPIGETVMNFEPMIWHPDTAIAA